MFLNERGCLHSVIMDFALFLKRQRSPSSILMVHRCMHLDSALFDEASTQPWPHLRGPQVHAPWPPSSSSSAGIPERSLLLLACTAPGCGTARGSWRAFRYQSTSSSPSSGSASGGAGDTGAQTEQRQHPQLQQPALEPFHVAPHSQWANHQSVTPSETGGIAGGLASRAPAVPAASGSSAPASDSFGGDGAFNDSTGAFGTNDSGWTVDGGGEAGSSMSFGDLDAALTSAVASRAASRSAAERSRREQQSQRDRQRGKRPQPPLPDPAAVATAVQSISTSTSLPGSITLRPQHGAAQQMGGGRSSDARAVWVAAGPVLPRFHLRWAEEPGKRPAAELREAEALHVAGLVDRYQADHEMVRGCQRATMS